MSSKFSLIIVLLACVVSAGIRPLVLMHGLMASSEAMSHLQQFAEADFPGIYVHNAEIGDGKYSSLLVQMNTQVDQLAAQIQADPLLAKGFDMVGHSQGGLLTRAYIERYNNPPVHNYISLAGPMAGVFGVPDFNDWCPDAECPWLIDIMNAISEGGWTEPIMQEYVTFAQYWKNPLNYSLYLNTSSFLPDINNEKAVKNATYRLNLISANTVTLVMAQQDHTVVPKESAWFQFFAQGQDTIVVNFTKTSTYVEDWIGLRTLDDAGKLHLQSVPCTHTNLPRQECKAVVYDPIIKPLIGGTI